jgi:hypothetical protein
MPAQSDSGRFPKTDLRYWKNKVFLLGSTYWVQIQFSGNRKKINLHHANVDQAAAKARDLYRSLLSTGWEDELTLACLRRRLEEPGTRGSIPGLVFSNALPVQSGLHRAQENGINHWSICRSGERKDRIA